MTGLENVLILTAYALLGILEVFFGFRLFRAVATITGALLGLTFGPAIYLQYIGESPELFAAAVSAAVGAVLFGVLAFLAVWVAALLWGASLGFALGVTFSPTPMWPVVLAVLLGGFSAAFARPTLAVLTSLHGAWLLTAAIAAVAEIVPFYGIYPLTGDQLMFSAYPWLASVAVGIGVLGAVFQLRQAALAERRIGVRTRIPSR